jgi:hypothetical protein
VHAEQMLAQQGYAALHRGQRRGQPHAIEE